MSTVWSTRSTGYKVGVGGMFFSAFLYLLGYCLPYWVVVENHFYSGLWLVCSRWDSVTKCASAVNSRTTSWYQAIQALEAVGLIALIIAGLFSLYTNCRLAPPASHNRLVEALSATGGVLGVIACMIFVGKTQELGFQSAEYYSGGFLTNLAGSILLVIFAVVIASGNKPSTDPQASAGMVFHPGVITTTQATPSAAVAYPPPAAGVPQSGYGYDQGPSVGGQYPAGYGYPAPAYAGYPAGYPAPAPVQESK